MSVSVCAKLCRAQGPGKTGSGSCQTEGELEDLWQVEFKLKEDFFVDMHGIITHTYIWSSYKDFLSIDNVSFKTFLEFFRHIS